MSKNAVSKKRANKNGEGGGRPISKRQSLGDMADELFDASDLLLTCSWYPPRSLIILILYFLLTKIPDSLIPVLIL